jgi:hypothetical protein
MVRVDSQTEQRLFALLRSALFSATESVELFTNLTTTDWQRLYDLSLAQGVLAFAYDGMKQLSEECQPDIELKIQWAYNVNHIEKVYAHQLSVAKALTKTFAENDIQTLILKGLSLSALYPVPSHRQCGDIDIYLMGGYQRGNAIAEQRGAKVKYDYFVHSEFAIKGIDIENHQYFVNPTVNSTGAYIESALQRLVVNSTAHPIVDSALTPSPTFNTLFLARHSSWHFARESITLRDICDWAVLLSSCNGDMDSKAIMQLLQESGLERYAAIITTIAVKYLGITSPLPFTESYETLAERVKSDIINHDAIKSDTLFGKIRNRITRKWCYDLVVPDGYINNIWYSVKGYLQRPFAIFKIKL